MELYKMKKFSRNQNALTGLNEVMIFGLFVAIHSLGALDLWPST